MKILRHPAVAGSVRLFLLALLLTAALAGAFAFAPQSESAKPQNFVVANLLAASAFAQEPSAPDPKWGCICAPDVGTHLCTRLLCSGVCEIPGGAGVYFPVSPSGEQVHLWLCPDSHILRRCNRVRDCINAHVNPLFGIPLTPEAAEA